MLEEPLGFNYGLSIANAIPSKNLLRPAYEPPMVNSLRPEELVKKREDFFSSVVRSVIPSYLGNDFNSVSIYSLPMSAELKSWLLNHIKVDFKEVTDTLYVDGKAHAIFNKKTGEITFVPQNSEPTITRKELLELL